MTANTTSGAAPAARVGVETSSVMSIPVETYRGVPSVGELRRCAQLSDRLPHLERVLGSDHPDTVATKRALAGLAAEHDEPAAYAR